MTMSIVAIGGAIPQSLPIEIRCDFEILLLLASLRFRYEISVDQDQVGTYSVRLAGLEPAACCA